MKLLLHNIEKYRDCTRQALAGSVQTRVAGQQTRCMHPHAHHFTEIMLLVLLVMKIKVGLV